MSEDGPRARDGIGRRIGAILFGDRLGLALWLGLVATYVLLWRFELVLTDSYALSNLLVAVADGSLAVTEFRFPLDTVGAEQVQQGLEPRDGVYYGRNYGQVALAVPVLWTLRALATVFDVRVLVAAGWALLLLAFLIQVARLVGYPRRGRVLGAAVAGLAFLGTLGFGTDVDPRLLPVVALQLVNLLAAAGVGLVVYRLVQRYESRTVGLAAGLATGLATPAAFWATFPKRHVLVAFLLGIGLLAFAVSRDEALGDRRRLYARGAAYGAMGLVAWIHALEGFFLVATLASVDFATAERTDRRTLAVLGACLFLALAPTLATNVAVTGNPMEPPRLLGGVDGVEPGLTGGTGDAGTGGTGNGDQPATGGDAPGGGDGGSTGGDPASGGGWDPLGWVVGLLPPSVVLALGYVVGTVVEGLVTVTDLERTWHTFIRSGDYGHLLFHWAPYEPSELSVFESMPLLGACLALPIALIGRVRSSVPSPRAWSPRRLAPARKTDLLVGATAVVLTVIHLSRLPIHGQLTVRYLFPLYPLGVYAIARFSPVSSAVDQAHRTMAWTFAVGLAGAVLGALLVLHALDPARAEAVQAHGLVHLTLGLVLAAVVVARTVAPDRVGTRFLAGSLGVVGGVTASYYLLVALEYFTDGGYALDLTRVAAEFASVL